MPALKAFQDSAPRVSRQFNDAAYGVVLARNLEAVDPQVFMVKYPQLTFMNSGVAIDNTGGYSETIKSLRVRDQGEFRNAGDKSSNKGIISVAGDYSSLQVKEREAESEYSNTEIEQAKLQNYNLVNGILGAHAKVYQQEIDRSGYTGIKDISSSEGLLNYSSFSSTSATGAVASLTPKQLYDDIAGLIRLQHSAVNNVPEYMADKVSLPLNVANYMNGIYDDTSGRSVMDMLRQNFAGVDFIFTQYGTTDFLTTSAGCAWSSNTEAMKYRLPLPLTVGEVIKTGSFKFKVESKYRTAGLDILEDTAGYILTGL